MRPASAVRQLVDGHGVAGSRALPDTEFDAAWAAIVLPDDAKQRLARQAAATLKLRAAGIPFESLPLHGITLLLGPPGTGRRPSLAGWPTASRRPLDRSARSSSSRSTRTA